ncbi:MAG: extracellular solute-binding protein [Chloroflexi bacterium]|nr:extracellular solute-binding protein [Chloroflexota bacterium]
MSLHQIANRRVARRSFVFGALATAGAALLSACSAPPAPAAPTTAPKPAGTSAPPPVAVGGQASPAPAASPAGAAAASPAAGASPAASASPAAAAPVASPAAAASPAPSPAAQQAPVFTGRTVQIDFSHIWATPPGATSAQVHPAEQVVNAYNARNTGVKVNSRVDSTVYLESIQKAQADMAAGKPPALVMTPWAFINFAEAALNTTNLEDLAPAGELDTMLANMNPAAVNLVTLNGKRKGFPYALSCPVIYYNNDVLKKAGVEPAALFKDWAAFAELGPKIKAVTNAPIIGVGTNSDWPAQSLIQSAGGRILNDDNTPAIDSPESVTAMKTIADLNKAGLWSTATSQENNAAFSGGTLPLFMASVAALGGFRRNLSFDFNTSTFPLFTGKPRRMSAGGSYIGCYAKDKDQQVAAWDFLKFAASEEGTKIWMQTGYLNVTKHSVQTLPGQEAAYTQLNEGLTRETAWPGRRGAEASRVWDGYVQRIWSNDVSVEDGLKQAKAELTTLFSQA